MDVNRYWFRCPDCGQKLAQKEKGAVSSGVFIKCKKCRKEIEIKLKENESYESVSRKG